MLARFLNQRLQKIALVFLHASVLPPTFDGLVCRCGYDIPVEGISQITSYAAGVGIQGAGRLTAP
jgi:hypothetical protein